MIELLNIDCMEYMAGCPDKKFDLAIVDPPYGIGENASRGGKKYGKAAASSKKYTIKNWDDNSPEKKYFDELIRISKNQIIFGANHFISKIPYDSSCWIVWDKNNADNHYADCELAWTSFKSSVRKIKYTWNGMIQENMKNKEIRIHPTQKPITLYRWLLDNYAKSGDLILDTHAGSFSSAVACKEKGFSGVFCELDKEYFDGGKLRVDKASRQYELIKPEKAVNEQLSL